MKVVYYVIAVVILALAGFGIYTSHAQNNTPNNAADGVLIIEEEGYGVSGNTASTGVNQNSSDTLAQKAAQAKDNMAQKYQDQKDLISQKYQQQKDSMNQGYQNQKDQAVQKIQDNQTTVDKAMKNQNPQYNNGEIVIEEDEIETVE